MTPMWVPLCVCRCGGRLESDRWLCEDCGHAYASADGLLHWIDQPRLSALEPFLEQYREVRRRDGYRNDEGQYYRRLPEVASTDPQHAIWRVRAESFQRLRQLLVARFPRLPAKVLDLGAGSGWLSARMSEMGWHPVAVDVLADASDGLGACRHYRHTFPRVIADFDDLPFGPRQFDAVIFNGSLHYAPDTSTSLTRAARQLAPGGIIVVADSPMFESSADGRRMCERNRERFSREYAIDTPTQVGEGFLTFAGLAAAARAMGREAHFFESRGVSRWRFLRSLRRALHRQTPPAFGVWVAT